MSLDRLDKFGGRCVYAPGSNRDPLRLAQEILESRRQWCRIGPQRDDRAPLGGRALDLFPDVRGCDTLPRWYSTSTPCEPILAGIRPSAVGRHVMEVENNNGLNESKKNVRSHHRWCN